MTRLILTAAAILGLSELATARAQYFGGPFYQSGFRSSYSYRSGVGFSVGGPRFRVSGFSAGFATRSVFVPPPVFVAPFGPVGFGGPFGGGWGPGFGGFGPFGPPVIAVPVPIPVVVGGNFPDPNEPPALPPPPNNPVLIPRAVRADDFLVIAPRREGVPELPRVADARPPIIMFDPFNARVRGEEPDPDPRREALRQMKLGRAAFATGEYGRAAEHFERASTADPADAVTYFLHGQAKFAAGDYAAAVARIRDGLARDPKWPLARFDPTELYGAQPERFVLHLIALKKAVADNPNQVPLEFLLGYQLWFSGDKVEANRLFRAAEGRLPEAGPLALFKLP